AGLYELLRPSDRVGVLLDHGPMLGQVRIQLRIPKGETVEANLPLQRFREVALAHGRPPPRWELLAGRTGARQRPAGSGLPRGENNARSKRAAGRSDGNTILHARTIPQGGTTRQKQ